MNIFNSIELKISSIMTSEDFLIFNELLPELQKEIILYADVNPAILSLVSKFFNEWSIPLKVTEIKNSLNMTNENLKKIQKTLTSLRLDCNDTITNEGLSRLTNLTSLILGGNSIITNDGLSGLTKLTSLSLGYNKTITNEGISKLTNLKSLNLKQNKKITDEGLSNLRVLTRLNLNYNNNITDEGLLKNRDTLKSLNLTYNNNITDECVQRLSYLRCLNLYGNEKITNYGILSKDLIFLDLWGNFMITDIRTLTSLEYLNLGSNQMIENGDLLYLKNTFENLKYLNLSYNTKITDPELLALKSFDNFFELRI